MTTVFPILIGLGFPAIALVMCAMATLGVARRKTPDGLKVIESLFTAVLFVVIARQFGWWQSLGSVGWFVLVAALAVATVASVLALWRLPLAQPDLPRSALIGRWVNAALAPADSPPERPSSCCEPRQRRPGRGQLQATPVA